MYATDSQCSQILRYLRSGRSLLGPEAGRVLDQVGEGKGRRKNSGSILTLLKRKNPSAADHIWGFSCVATVVADSNSLAEFRSGFKVATEYAV